MFFDARLLHERACAWHALVVNRHDNMMHNLLIHQTLENMATETQRTLLDVGLRPKRTAKASKALDKARAAPDLSPSKQASVQPQAGKAS